MPRNRPRPTHTQLTFSKLDPATEEEVGTLVVTVSYSPGTEDRLSLYGPAEVGDPEEIDVISYHTTGQADTTWVDSIIDDQDILLEKFHEDNPPGPLGYDR